MAGNLVQTVRAVTLPLPTGAATEATLAGVLTITDFDSKAGSLTETAPTTDTASSGLNGRLQRIAQRLTTALTGISLAAGSAIIGKVGIDQTTPGTTNNVTAVGPTASGATLTVAPVTTGGLAKTALQTAVADAQVVNAMFDKYGRAIMLAQAPRDLVGTQTTTISASTAETTIVTAAASIFADLVLLTVANTSATATRVDFRDDTAGSVIFALYCPAGATTGFVPHVPVPQTTANKNWTATCITSLTDLRIFAQWVKNR